MRPSSVSWSLTNGIRGPTSSPALFVFLTAFILPSHFAFLSAAKDRYLFAYIAREWRHLDRIAHE